MRFPVLPGEVPEWLIGTVCKIVALKGFAGSNPALSTTIDINVRAGHTNVIICII
jgi:hypothetical protein